MPEDDKSVEERLEALEMFLPILERRYGKRSRRKTTVLHNAAAQDALNAANSKADEVENKVKSVGTKKKKK